MYFLIHVQDYKKKEKLGIWSSVLTLKLNELDNIHEVPGSVGVRDLVLGL